MRWHFTNEGHVTQHLNVVLLLVRAVVSVEFRQISVLFQFCCLIFLLPLLTSSPSVLRLPDHTVLCRKQLPELPHVENHRRGEVVCEVWGKNTPEGGRSNFREGSGEIKSGVETVKDRGGFQVTDTYFGRGHSGHKSFQSLLSKCLL